MRNRVCLPGRREAILLHGVRSAVGPRVSVRGSIEIADGRFVRMGAERKTSFEPDVMEIDLQGFQVLPGLINAHDHLQFSVFPRLGNPPYHNYIEWGEDIHRTLPEQIAKYKSIPRKVRLWWGGIRNLLCGVTTVCHHDSLWQEMQREEFPLRVVQRYGWAHSVALESDLQKRRSITPDRSAFIVHACEGSDDLAAEEIFALDRLGVLDASTVMVHGLALGEEGIALMRKRGASLIVCPSSNLFLFDRLPNMNLLGTLENIALGNDSPLTATGDLLDEIRFAHERCHLSPDRLYRMVTETAALILCLNEGEGKLDHGASADLVAIRDTGKDAAERIPTLCSRDVELVMVRGQIQLASEAIWELLPPQMKQGMEPLWIDGVVRWLRAPLQQLLQQVEAVLGAGEVRLGKRTVKRPEVSTIVSAAPSQGSHLHGVGRE